MYIDRNPSSFYLICEILHPPPPSTPSLPNSNTAIMGLPDSLSSRSPGNLGLAAPAARSTVVSDAGAVSTGNPAQHVYLGTTATLRAATCRTPARSSWR